MMFSSDKVTIKTEQEIAREIFVHPVTAQNHSRFFR